MFIEKNRQLISKGKTFKRIFFIGGLGLTLISSLNSLGQIRILKDSLSRDSTSLRPNSIKRQNLNRISELQEISVTATKFPKKLSETGKVLDIIRKDILDRSQGKTLADVLNDIPGIQIDGSHINPGYGAKSIFLQGASGDYTLILIDGVPVTDPSTLGSSFDIRLLNLEQFERIEILKGGQSTLYGTDAVAGVINLISRKPENQKIKVSTLFSGGSYGSFKENLNFSQKINPNWSYSGSYIHFKTNGIPEARDNGTDSVNIGHFHKNGLKEDVFTAIGQYSKGSFNFSPTFRYAHISGTFSNGAFMDGLNPYYGKTISTGFNSHYLLESGGSLNFSDGFTYTQRFYGGPYPSSYTGRFNQAEIYMEKPLGRFFQILGGLNYQTQQVLDTAQAAIKKNPSISILSPYISLFLNHFHSFNFSVGGRLNHNSSYGNNYTYNLNPSYNLSKDLKLFIDYATSYRAPKLSELYGEFGANPNLKPETSISIEGGLSGNFIQARNQSLLNFRLLGFHRSIHQAIVYLYPKGYLNENAQLDHGFEASGNYQINQKIKLQASYTFVTGHVQTKSANTGNDTSINNLLRRPKNAFSFGLNYEPLPALLVNLSFKTYGKRVDEDFNTGSFVPLEGYQLLDAYIRYTLGKKKHIQLFTQLNNILGSSYTEIIGFTTQKFSFNSGIQITF